MPSEERTATTHRFECHLCEPHQWLPLEDLHLHFRVEHDMDIDELAEKWPDGEYVVVDETLEPGDFGG